MRKAWMVLLALALVALTAGAACADDLTGRIGLGLGGGVYKLAGNADSSASHLAPTANAKLGWHVMPFSLKWGIWKHTTAEANVHYGFNGSNREGEENYRTREVPVSANLLFPLNPNSKTVIYLLAGGGILDWHNTLKTEDDDDQESDRGMAAQAVASQRTTVNKSQDMMGTVGGGFEFFFGGSTAAERTKSFDLRLTHSWYGNQVADVGQFDNNDRMWMATAAINFYSKMKGAEVPGFNPSQPPATPTTPSITTSCPIPSGTVGQPYTSGFSATGGTPPYNWAILDGQLPAGLTIDAGSGTVSGTPTAVGHSTFTVGLTDANGQKDQKACAMDVNDATAPAKESPCDLKDGSLEGVYFDFDKSVVKPEFNPTLNDLAEKLNAECKDINIRLDGHTDAKGSDAYNMRLGQRRADAVKAYLVSKGVAESRLETKSFGESTPVAPNSIGRKDNPEGRAKNRRVELHINS